MPRSARATARPSVVMLALASGAFVIGASQPGASAVILDQAHDFGTSVDVVGYTMSAYAAGVVISSPLLAIVLARVDRRRIVQSMMAVALVVNVAITFAPSVGALGVLRFFGGVPHGMYLAAASVAGAAVLGPSRRGRAIALTMVGFTVAVIVGVPVMQWVSGHLSWRWDFAGIAVAAAIALVLITATVPSVPAPRVGRRRASVAHLRGAKVWTAIAFAGVGFAGQSTVITYQVPILREINGLDVTQVAFALSAGGVVTTIALLVAGRLAERGPVLPARVGAVLHIAAFLTLGIAGESAAVSVPAFFLLLSGGALMSQGAMGHSMDVVEASPMLGASISHSALNVANALGAAVGGLVIGAGFGLLATPFVAVAFTATGLVLLLVGPGFRGPVAPASEPRAPMAL
jgi:DHA1 family inner membrane transport protein